MKVNDFRRMLERLKDDDDVVIGVKRLHTAIGPCHSIAVTGIHSGFDWDCGKAFITAEVDLREVDAPYEEERKRSYERGEALAFVWMSASDKRLDDKQKLAAIRRTLKAHGFSYGLDDLPENQE